MSEKDRAATVATAALTQTARLPHRLSLLRLVLQGLAAKDVPASIATPFWGGATTYLACLKIESADVCSHCSTAVVNVSATTNLINLTLPFQVEYSVGIAYGSLWGRDFAGFVRR